MGSSVGSQVDDSKLPAQPPGPASSGLPTAGGRAHADVPEDPLRKKRILAEAKRCAGLTLEKDGVCVDAASAQNPNAPWTAYIQGPLRTVWERAVFKVEISFPSKYPWQPLRVRFVHGLFHPNVAEDGSICSRYEGDFWSPALGPGAMLVLVRALLDKPSFSARDLGEDGSAEAVLAADARARSAGGLAEHPQKLYHYTDGKAIDAISNTWELRPSSWGAAGAGVYATTMHPTNCTRAQIATNNWGGVGFGGGDPKTDFVIELDVGILQEQGFQIERVTERNIWMVKSMARGVATIRLDDSNSVISKFEMMSTCQWNSDAGLLLSQNLAGYESKVEETIRRFGQEISDVARQR